MIICGRRRLFLSLPSSHNCRQSVFDEVALYATVGRKGRESLKGLILKRTNHTNQEQKFSGRDARRRDQALVCPLSKQTM